MERIFTILFLGFLLTGSSAHGEGVCPTGQEQCYKFTLYSIDDSNIREFNERARCCFLPRRDGSGIVANPYPPAARNEEIHWKILYDAEDGYKSVLSLTLNYPLCRTHATLIEGFVVNLRNINSGGLISKRINIINGTFGADSKDKLSIEVRIKDDILLRNDSEYSLSVESLPADSSRPTNVAQVKDIRTRTSVTKRDAKETGSQTQRAKLNELIAALDLQRRDADLTPLQKEIRKWVPRSDVTYSKRDNDLYLVLFWFIQAPCDYGFQYYRISMNNCTNDTFSDCDNQNFFKKNYGEGKNCDSYFVEGCIMKDYHNTSIRIRDIAPGYYKIYLWPRKGDTIQLPKNVSIVAAPPGRPSPAPTYLTTAQPGGTNITDRLFSNGRSTK